jgi:hypothetical protein
MSAPRQMRAVPKAQINKTDRNDARGMAQMIRLLTIENDLRGTLRNFGLKVGMVGAVNLSQSIRMTFSVHTRGRRPGANVIANVDEL